MGQAEFGKQADRVIGSAFRHGDNRHVRPLSPGPRAGRLNAFLDGIDMVAQHTAQTALVHGPCPLAPRPCGHLETFYCGAPRDETKREGSRRPARLALALPSANDALPT